MKFILKPGQLQFSDLRILMDESTTLELDSSCIEQIHAAEKVITTLIAEGKTIYGVNTGFGLLATTKVNSHELEELQRAVILSAAAGTGPLLCDKAVRLILALKINSLARGYSGVSLKTIEALVRFYNGKFYPCIPSQGSVGASGDLAPLGHLSAALLGEGNVSHEGKIISAAEALIKLDLHPLKLGPKEGLALINGTQVSTALAIIGLFAAEEVFVSAIAAGAMTVEAARASYQPFDERIHLARGHAAQIKVASLLRTLLDESEIHQSHHVCEKVQDPYSIRCQPQVMGACLNQLLMNSQTLLIEANAVSDNPLIFTQTNDILSGGNFHAEPIAMAADAIAVSIAEMASLSERRIAMLVDPHFSRLPAFLVNNPGVNSGFMIAQVTAAALVSENKTLAHPASVDSIPTSANQEDHVSMATFAARRLSAMAENAMVVTGIELLAACQGLDFLKPLKPSPRLESLHHLIRQKVAFYDKDRFFAPDIDKIKLFIQSGSLRQHLDLSLFNL